MFKFFRRKKKVLEPLYEVQLHRATRNGQFDEIEILSSWEPIRVRGSEEAQERYMRLYQDARWATDMMFPYVTMKKVDEENG